MLDKTLVRIYQLIYGLVVPVFAQLMRSHIYRRRYTAAYTS